MRSFGGRHAFPCLAFKETGQIIEFCPPMAVVGEMKWQLSPQVSRRPVNGGISAIRPLYFRPARIDSCRPSYQTIFLPRSRRVGCYPRRRRGWPSGCRSVELQPRGQASLQEGRLGAKYSPGAPVIRIGTTTRKSYKGKMKFKKNVL